MSQHTMTSPVGGSGSVTLVVEGDFLAMTDAEVEFIFGLRDRFREHGAKSTNGAVVVTETQLNVPGGGSTEPLTVTVTKAAVPPRATAGKRRRFTDDQKAEAVREAEQEGYRATAIRLGVADTQIHRWKREGLGKRPVAMHGDNYNNGEAAKAAAGPAVRCPVCHVGCPVVDPSDNDEKRRVLGAHFKESPDCKETMRRRG